MSTTTEIWMWLNNGYTVTNGSTTLYYKDGELHGADNGIVPFDATNVDEWYVVKSGDKLYYRWVTISDDDKIIQFSEGYQREDVELIEGWQLHGKGLTREQVLAL